MKLKDCSLRLIKLIYSNETDHEKGGEKIQNSKIWNGRGYPTTDSTDIKRIIREYSEKLYAIKQNNLSEMHIFFKIHKAQSRRN
jgi:hypothetical protein